MKKVILIGIIVSSLGIGTVAGASFVTLNEKTEELKHLYSQSIENYFHDREEPGEAELQRLESETRAYLSTKLETAKEQDRERITKETDQKIEELKHFIDSLLIN